MDNDLENESHKKRNLVVRETHKLCPDQHKNVIWPDSVLSFQGAPDIPSFESYRDEFYRQEAQIESKRPSRTLSRPLRAFAS